MEIVTKNRANKDENEKIENLPLEESDRPCVAKVVGLDAKGGRGVDNVVGDS